MKEPLVSVVVPVYNTMAYLESCVRSITDQTYTNLEIILVDDGSTDGSDALCDELSKQDNRIRIIHISNGGVGPARNRALDIANGGWVAFVDSDDVVEAWHIETLLAAALNEGAEVVLGGYRTLQDDCLGQLVSPDTKKSLVSARRALEMLMYQEGIDTAPWGKLYKMNKFDGVRFPALPSSEDLATVYKPILMSSKVALIDDSGYRYRMTKGSLSVSKHEEAAWRVARTASEDILLTYPDLDKACSCRRLSFAFHVMTQVHDPSIMNELWHEVISTRNCVLKDRRARKKTRAAALASYAGRQIVLAIAKHQVVTDGKDKER